MMALGQSMDLNKNENFNKSKNLPNSGVYWDLCHYCYKALRRITF